MTTTKTTRAQQNRVQNVCDTLDAAGIKITKIQLASDRMTDDCVWVAGGLHLSIGRSYVSIVRERDDGGLVFYPLEKDWASQLATLIQS